MAGFHLPIYRQFAAQAAFQVKLEMTALERAVSVFSPKRATAMAHSRFGVQFAGQYAGARREKTSLKNFNPSAGSADSDSIGDLPTLRARSRDLGRNAPIARGARNTSRTNVVGAGLRLSSHLQRECALRDAIGIQPANPMQAAKSAERLAA